MKKSFLVLIALITLFSFSARAQDAGLYDPVAPEGSAFVRFINLGTGKDALKPSIRGKAYRTVDFDEISPYVPVKGGDSEIKFGEQSVQHTFDKKMFYTVILKGDTLNTIKDASIENPVKALIIFYNLTDESNLSLKTTDGKVEVIAPVSAGKSGYREINGVQVKLSVYQGDKKLADIEPVLLKRSEATTVMVTQIDNEIKTKTVQAETDTAP